jgi:hypothetical protein
VQHVAVTDAYAAIEILAWPGLTVVRLYESTLQHIAEQQAEFALPLPSLRSGRKRMTDVNTAPFQTTYDRGSDVLSDTASRGPCAIA